VRHEGGGVAKYALLVLATEYGNRRIIADWRGQFAFGGLPAGEYQLHARARWKETPEVGPMLVRTGTEITVTLSEPGDARR
jgi:hypothetical protein